MVFKPIVPWRGPSTFAVGIPQSASEAVREWAFGDRRCWLMGPRPLLYQSDPSISASIPYPYPTLLYLRLGPGSVQARSARRCRRCSSRCRPRQATPALAAHHRRPWLPHTHHTPPTSGVWRGRYLPGSGCPLLCLPWAAWQAWQAWHHGSFLPCLPACLLCPAHYITVR